MKFGTPSVCGTHMSHMVSQERGSTLVEKLGEHVFESKKILSHEHHFYVRQHFFSTHGLNFQLTTE